jgi:putative pyruvate formate lyase activating enzyme
MKVAYVGPHLGEEPPISAKRGSGTVFFTGCSMRCAFCQNYQISHTGLGKRFDRRQLVTTIMEMIREKAVHNINFVSPDHFWPDVIEIVKDLSKNSIHLPVVLNLSGYQTREMLKSIEQYSDIYLPDFKYAHPQLAARLSACPEYPQVAYAAISEMLKQKGYLLVPDVGYQSATRGVLVRHLILPGFVQNSIDVLTGLFLEFGADLPVSLMSQYSPVLPQRAEGLNRRLTEEEFFRVYGHAKALGFTHLYVQFPQKDASQTKSVSPFVPDFRKTNPFGLSAR